MINEFENQKEKLFELKDQRENVQTEKDKIYQNLRLTN